MSLTPEAFNVIDAIHEHWVMGRVEEADDMRAELADHFEDALSHGKTIDEVTGPNLRAFADSWAAERPHEPQRLEWGSVVVGIVAVVITVVALVPLLAAIEQGSLMVVIEPRDIAFVIAFAFFPAALWRSRLTHGARPRAQWRSFIKNTLSMVLWASAFLIGVRLWGPPEFELQRSVALLAMAPFAMSLLASGVMMMTTDTPSPRVLLGFRDPDLGRSDLRNRVEYPVSLRDLPPPPETSHHPQSSHGG